MCGAPLQLGADANGTEMVRQMESAGVNCSAVMQDTKSQTALAVLPIYAATGGTCLQTSP
jgi:sugar/nucleoside kinase (ribokinase family)